ncbi:MAG TPA: ABC transporter ATP-binding protein [Pirellulaceae bacterium]
MIDKPPIVELRGLTKLFRGHAALKDLTLRVPPGVTGLLGPNGAGKSTLIKILLGLIRATHGEGSILGIPLGTGRFEVLERVGYVPEDDCYLPGLTAIETVQMAGRLSRIPTREALRRGHEILDVCGMGQERYRNIETLSTGMRQKVRFAAALVHDPELLILDEPTAGLDPDERVAMLRRIRRLAEDSGKSVILCTHILHDVESISDYVVILSHGVSRLADSIEVLRRPASPQILVAVLGPPGRFEEHVVAQGVRVESLGGGRFHLHGDTEQLLTRAWEWADACGVALQRVQPAQNSLQQVFLSAIREAPHATP